MMTAKTLREAIADGFAGFKRERVDYWYGRLPESDFYFVEYDGVGESTHYQRFAAGENFEEVDLRTWLCTDTEVGLYAVLWDGEFFALHYKGARKSERRWFYANEDSLTKFVKAWMKYADFETDVTVLGSEDYDFVVDSSAKYTWETGPIRRIK